MNIVISILKQFLFWLLLFFFLRIIFLIYNQGILAVEEASFGEIIKSFWYGFRTDIASVCYLLVIPSFILIVQQFKPWAWLNFANKFYYIIMLMLYALITVGELGIYPEWKTKLSAKALLYLQRPDEAFNSISLSQVLSLIGLAIFITFGSHYLYRKYFFTPVARKSNNWIMKIAFSLLILPVLFLGIRGGISPIPISPSAAYFSQHSILNHTALNSGFNLAISMLEYNKFRYKNPFENFSKAEAEQIVGDFMRVEKDTTINILNTQCPNIIIVLLESWSADLIESLGGKPGITPEFAKLEQDGILCTHHFTSGSRSQQALSAILGGFPAIPLTTVTENASKYSQLPSLSKSFNEEGYYSSFYFGGQLVYGNMKAYIYYNEFDKIFEEKDFDAGIPHGRLGVHDEYLFAKHLEDLNEMPQPFFSIAFTSSSHSPYDHPMENVIDWGGNENDFINSAFYSDKQLGTYLREAKKQSWYPNTLFILVADHSHNTYRNWPLESFDYHKIPLLFYGDVIKNEFKGERIGKIISHSDLPKTLLKQVGIPAEEFKWSRDIFNPYTPEYAFFELHYAYGWKQPQGSYVYSWDWKKYYEYKFVPGTTKQEEDKIIKNGKAYLQVLFQEFLDM